MGKAKHHYYAPYIVTSSPYDNRSGTTGQDTQHGYISLSRRFGIGWPRGCAIGRVIMMKLNKRFQNYSATYIATSRPSDAKPARQGNITMLVLLPCFISSVLGGLEIAISGV